MPKNNPPFIRERNVYYDSEAYVSPTTMLGKIVNKYHAKYRIFVREVLGFFIFFFTTSQNHPGRKYVDILKNDWIRKNKTYLCGDTRVEISDCCFLNKSEVKKKRKKRKIKNVGEIKQCLIDRIRIAYEEGGYVSPRKPRAGTVPIELAFQEQQRVEIIARNLGIF